MSETPAPRSKRSLWVTGCLSLPILLFGFVVFLLLFPDVNRPGGNDVPRFRSHTDLVNICTALKAYRTEYGMPPSGNHAQIFAAVCGANPRKIVFFEPKPEQFNARGEYLDPWKTPYHIDVSRPESPWAYSFGKNRRDDGGVPGSDDIVSWR